MTADFEHYFIDPEGPERIAAYDENVTVTTREEDETEDANPVDAITTIPSQEILPVSNRHSEYENRFEVESPPHPFANESTPLAYVRISNARSLVAPSHESWEVVPDKNRWRRWLVRIAIVAAGVVGAGGVFAVRHLSEASTFQQANSRGPAHNGVYVNNERGFQSPSDRGIQNWEPVEVPLANGGLLKGVILKQAEFQKVPTLIFFHGNASNVGTALEQTTALYKRLGVNVVSVDYRGFGASSDTASEDNLAEDAVSIVQHTARKLGIDDSMIYVMGHSLGSVAASHVLSDVRTRDLIAGGVVACGITSAEDQACALYPFASPLFKAFPFLLKYPLNVKSRVSNVSRPMMFIGADNDDVLPPSMTRDLYNTCGSSSKQLGMIFQGSHTPFNEADQVMWTKLRKFLDDPTAVDTPVWEAGRV